MKFTMTYDNRIPRCVFAVGLGVFLPWLLTFIEPQTLIVNIIASIFMVYILLDTALFKIQVDGEKITVYKILHKKKTVDISEIKEYELGYRREYLGSGGHYPKKVILLRYGEDDEIKIYGDRYLHQEELLEYLNDHKIPCTDYWHPIRTGYENTVN